MPKEIKFESKILDGDKGKLMLEINKTFKGDSRFKLDERFEKDVDIEKMPDKFKQKLENDLLQKVKEKTKNIKKEQPPLIIRRFEPGTQAAQTIVKKAEGKKQYIESLVKAEKKKLKKKKEVNRGIDKIKKADKLLERSVQFNKPEFKLQLKGSKKEMFKQSEFKLFE